MFKKTFIKLCNQKGESPSFVCRKVGITPATFSGWTEETVPREATLMRIAEYFDVSVDYLLGKEEKLTTEGSEQIENNVVVFHRDGKTVTKKFTPAQMELIEKLLNEIPEDK